MDANTALADLRAARIRLFEACQRRDALVGRRPIPQDRVVAVNAEIAQLRAEVEAARAAARVALDG